MAPVDLGRVQLFWNDAQEQFNVPERRTCWHFMISEQSFSNCYTGASFQSETDKNYCGAQPWRG
jgi:hypothetical protein